MKLFKTRFDFGVPLEDVFPPNDIHPRLKYLFKEAYQLCVQSSLSIHQILRECQGSLEMRLELKHRLVYDSYFEHLSNYLPGTYFWLIRHFIGLLPIPLLPKYANCVTFDWEYLAEKYKRFLKKYQNHREKKFELDYILAQNLNMLPFEHFLLLHILISFIRKLSHTSINNPRLCRKKLVVLVNFYCGAIFTRPYRPGYEKEDTKMIPLFVYILLRWREIEKISNKIGHPVYFLESEPVRSNNIYREKLTKDKWVQTYTFDPDIITVCRNIPYFVDDNVYLKDIASQTETPTITDAEVQMCISPEDIIDTDGKLLEEFQETVSISVANSTLENLNDTSTNLADCTFVTAHDKSKINEDSCQYSNGIQECKNESPKDQDDEAVADEINEKYRSPSESIENAESFFSITAPNKEEKWSDIVTETSNTVKKVEEYIYDDYETFKEEQFNQLTNTLAKPPLLKIPKSNGVSQISPRKPHPEIFNNDPQMSYRRYDNGIDQDFNNSYSPESLKATENSMNVTFRSCYNSEERLWSGRSSKDDKKSRTNFNLKRFKIKMDFLRILTPKKSDPIKPCDDYNISNINYKKIKNLKAYTI